MDTTCMVWVAGVPRGSLTCGVTTSTQVFSSKCFHGAVQLSLSYYPYKGSS